MRRGWILLLTIVLLLLGSAFAWWWSTPGQLWWLRVKADRDIPPLIGPGGMDPLMAEEAITWYLEPQVSRLISRDYVRWYGRKIRSGPTAEQFRRVRQRMSRELSIPHPFDWFCDLRMLEPAQDSDDTLVFKLLPPDQHEVLARICLEELGTVGEPISVERICIIPWELLPHIQRE